jgi:phosphate starvation-inducible protein PhoH
MKEEAMTEPQAAKKEKFTIHFPEDRAQDWSTLAYLTLQKKFFKMGSVIQEAFGVEFEKLKTSNAITDPVKSISFWGLPESEEKVKKTLAALMTDFDARSYFNREGVQKITKEINEGGHFTPASAAFNREAANGNEPQQGHKREATEAQKNMENLITQNSLVFGIGPAGTGKTYVAMKMGVEALKSGKVKKLLLARPAAEAGEKIGFLPGSQEDKLAPYMRPLYDELDKAFGRAKWKKMMENGDIEVTPVGYMRGRTFNDAFIVVDEAQNMTKEQIEMAATRIGFNSKMVVTGDPNQIDLSPKSLSYLMPFVGIMRGEKGVGIQEFSVEDCVRSEISQTIVNAIQNKQGPQAPQPLENKTAKPNSKVPAVLRKM